MKRKWALDILGINQKTTKIMDYTMDMLNYLLSSSMGGTSNVGVPTLTTPTLPPTTLRNIEQMFAGELKKKNTISYY